MKPQIIIPASLLVLSLFFSGRNGFAAGKAQQDIKTEKADFKPKSANSVSSTVDHTSTPQKQKNPAAPKQKENKKDSIPHNESHKKAHGEEDGKHHHFHLHRAKKVKRHSNLVCFIAKLLVVITHICLLVYTYNAPFAH